VDEPQQHKDTGEAAEAEAEAGKQRTIRQTCFIVSLGGAGVARYSSGGEPEGGRRLPARGAAACVLSFLLPLRAIHVCRVPTASGDAEWAGDDERA
jgi:hypothetical protein